MTKFGLVSDLHLDFYKVEDQIKIENYISNISENYDYFILAGDIYEDNYYNKKFLQKIKSPLFVRGNHDYYSDRNNMISQCLWTREISGLKVLGTTFWTNMNRGNPIDKQIFTTSMHDSFKIKPYGFALTSTVYNLHIDSVNRINQYKPDLVITHHCPTTKSVHPQFLGNIMNSCFHSVYDDKFFDDWENIKVWCYGHTHWRHEYKINNTKFYCNPLGYPGEIKENYKILEFEL